MSYFGGQCYDYGGGATSLQGGADPCHSSFGNAPQPLYLQTVPLDASAAECPQSPPVSLPIYAFIPCEYQVIGAVSALQYDASYRPRPQDLRPSRSKGSSSSASPSKREKRTKWYELDPQEEPTSEEKRLRALKAKANRQRRKTMEEEMRQEMSRVTDDIMNIREEVEERRLTCMSLERRLDEATQNHNVVDYSKCPSVFLHLQWF